MEFQDYEYLLKHVYRTAPIGLCLFDTELRYRHINEWLASINGLSVEKHLGHTIGEVIPDVSAGVESILRRVMDTGEPVLNGVVEAETSASPEQTRIFQHSYHAVESDEGEVMGVSCIVQDITDRKRAEAALVEANCKLAESVRLRTEKLTQSELRQRHLLESSRAVPWEVDVASFQFTYVGPQADELLGYPHMQWLDNDFWPSHIHPEDREFAKDYCLRTMKSKANFDFEYRMIAADGSTVWIHDIVNVESEAGEPKRLRGFMIDISERKKTEYLLKDSEARFRMIYEHAPVMIDAYDKNGRCVMFNKECEKVFGWTAEEVFALDNPLMAFYPDPEIRRQVLETVTTKPEKTFQEWKQTGKDGSETSCLWANFRLPDGLVINIGYDITERKQAEEALREGATRLQLATDATHIGLWDHDLRTDDVYFSPEWKRQLGYEDHELTNGFGTWESHLHPDDRAYTTTAYESYIAGHQKQYEIEFRLRHKDGSYRWIYTRGEKHCDETGKTCRVFGCHVDITDRKKTETLLREHRNTLQILARKLLSAQEDERRRLARELHDDLSQRLAAIGIDSMILERNVRAVSESCADEVMALNGRIRKISADIHQISRQLHPSILDELGLVKAMKGECDAYTRRTGISIRFMGPGEYKGVEKSTELAMYRIMQECLQNVVKHSRAVSASVELAVDDENISLSVRDTGIGFDLSEESNGRGVGMASIRERAELLLGSVSIESATGKGTTVNVTIPIRGTTL